MGKHLIFLRAYLIHFILMDHNYIMPMKVSYEGKEDIISYSRQLVGKTNPKEAAPDSIRGKNEPR